MRSSVCAHRLASLCEEDIHIADRAVRATVTRTASVDTLRVQTELTEACEPRYEPHAVVHQILTSAGRQRFQRRSERQ